MKNVCLFFPLCVLVLFNSCSVLTKSQIKNVNVFAAAAKNYCSYPGEIIKKRAELVLEEKLAGAIQLSPDQIKVKIADAQKNYESQQKLADKFDLSLKLIGQYAGLLSELSSEKFVDNLSTNTDNLNDNLSGLVKMANARLLNKIPASVGDAIIKAIFFTGERFTKNKQAKALKEFIPQGDTLVKITVKNLVEALSTDLPDLIAGDKEKFINTYTNNVLAKENKVDYTSLKQYSVALNNYDNLEQLRAECVAAANKLLLAHAVVTADIRSKNNVKEIFAETQELIVSIQDLYKSFSQLSSGK